MWTLEWTVWVRGSLGGCKELGAESIHGDRAVKYKSLGEKPRRKSGTVMEGRCEVRESPPDVCTVY